MRALAAERAPVAAEVRRAWLSAGVLVLALSLMLAPPSIASLALAGFWK